MQSFGCQKGYRQLNEIDIRFGIPTRRKEVLLHVDCDGACAAELPLVGVTAIATNKKTRNRWKSRSFDIAFMSICPFGL